MAQEKDKLTELIQPLNEMGDREIKTPTVVEIFTQLEQINANLEEAGADLKSSQDQIKTLQNETNELLDGEKLQKLSIAKDYNNILDNLLAEMDLLRKDCKIKLEKNNQMINNAKTKEGQNDVFLMGSLKKLGSDSAQIGESLKDIDQKSADFAKRRKETKILLDAIAQSPLEQTPQQIDELIELIDDLNLNTQAVNEKLHGIDKDFDKRIQELTNLINQSINQKALEKDINQRIGLMKDNLIALKETQGKVCGINDKLLETLGEMTKGSLPDKTADYWEEREAIENWTEQLQTQNGRIKIVKESHENYEKNHKDLQAQIKKATDIPQLEDLLKQVQSEADKVALLVEEGYDIQDIINNI